MNRTKVQTGTDNNKFVTLLTKVMPRQNGTAEGFAALAASLKRNDAYAEAQQVINDACLPSKSELSNTFIVKEATNA